MVSSYKTFQIFDRSSANDPLDFIDEKTPQILENIPIKNRDILKKLSLKNAIKVANKMIKGQGRILVRKSGTEEKIRIMGESKNKILLTKCIKTITKTIY